MITNNRDWKIELYRLNVEDEEFVLLDEITSFLSISFFNKLNGAGGCRFTLHINDGKASSNNLVRYRTTILIKYKGIVVWSGFVIEVSGNYSSSGSSVISVEGIEYFGHFKYRITGSLDLYTNTDAGEIAWQMINTSQSKTNGTLLISKGGIEATKNRDRTYENYIIYDAIVNLTNVIDGFDFELVPTLDSSSRLEGFTFNVYKEIGVVRESLGYLKIDEEVENVRLTTVGDVYNSIVATSGGFGDQVLRSTQSDTSSQKGYTLLEKYLKFANINIASTLEEHANTYLNNVKVNRYSLDLTLNSNIGIGQINIGDYVNVNLVLGEYTTIKKKIRVDAKSVNVDNVGEYKINIRSDVI